MIYKVLTERQTSFWLKNMREFIDLAEKLLALNEQKLEAIRTEYNENYQNTVLKRFLNPDSYYIWKHKGKTRVYSSCQSILMDMFFDTGYNELKKIQKFEDYESDIYWLSDSLSEYLLKVKQNEFQWSEFAGRPFQIDQQDLEKYLTIVSTFNNDLLPIAKKAGLVDEAYHMDENC